MSDCSIIFPKAAILPANYRIECFDCATALYATKWSALTQDDLFYNIDYLAEVERTCKAYLQPKYGIVYNDDEAVGAFYFQLVRFKGKQLIAFLSKEKKGFWYENFIETPAKLILERIDKPLLVLGNLLQTNHCGIFFCPSITDPKEKALIVETLCKKTQKICAASAILITNIYESNNHFLNYLDASFHQFHSEPDLQLTIDPTWKTMEDYLQSLHSKYRVRAKKILKESADLEVRPLQLEEIKQYNEKIFALNRQVMKHVKFSVGDISPGYFYDIASYFGERFTMNGYFKNGELIGFSSLITENKILNSHFIGMNYEFINANKLYNRILYDNLQFGIEHQLELVKYGRTATEIKTTIGAKPLAMVNYIKHQNSMINYFVPRVLNLLKAPEFIIRNPFK